MREAHPILSPAMCRSCLIAIPLCLAPIENVPTNFRNLAIAFCPVRTNVVSVIVGAALCGAQRYSIRERVTRNVHCSTPSHNIRGVVTLAIAKPTELTAVLARLFHDAADCVRVARRLHPV